VAIKHKNISYQSNTLLSNLIEAKRLWFDISTAYQLLPDSNTDAVKKLLSDMTKRGLLMRVKEGIYYVIPFEQDAKTFMPDWHLLAEPLAGQMHYVGYYSALQIHQLITQPSLKEQIVVGKQIKPSETKIKGVKFQFIYHNEKHYFGQKKTWIDSFNSVWCSDLEKTLIDCLYKPDYAGGIVEIAKAIFIAKEKINFEKLLKYVTQFDSQAVTKRLGCLLDLLEINVPIIEELQKNRSSSISPLDSEMPKQGKIISRWNIQQNVDVETIKSAILT
jgi:predicted transcriptional regulator of viral defense system